MFFTPTRRPRTNPAGLIVARSLAPPNAAPDQAITAPSRSANRPIRRGDSQRNGTDPLHDVSVCCFNRVLTNGNGAAVARLLLAFGAALNGSDGRESPLIGATSLNVEGVAEVLIRAGVDLELTSIFGANALHWAA